MIQGNVNDRKTETVTIASAGSLSGEIALGGRSALGLLLPTGAGSFDANTDAIYFSVSLDGSTWVMLRDADGTLVSVTVAAANTNGACWLPAWKFAAWNLLKLGTYRSDTGAAVAQAGGARTFTLSAGSVTG